MAENKEFTQLVKIALQNHKLPQYTEVKQSGKDFIYFGEKNDYPQYLINLYMRSPKHNAILSGKVHWVTGKGWTVNRDGLNTAQQADLQEYILKPNPYETLNDLLNKVAFDFELFNGFVLQPIPEKVGGKLAELYHVPLQYVRTNEDESEYYYTTGWLTKDGELNFHPEKNKDWKVYKPFDPENPGKDQLLYYRQYTPKISLYDIYPEPEYIGSIPWIETDFEIANFHYNNIKNSFWGSYMISLFNGLPSEEEQKKQEKIFTKKFTGTDNAGRFILNWNDDPARAPKLEPLVPPDLDKMFDLLNKTVQQEIFTGHKVTSPMLFGIKTEGQLGGRTELLEASELFHNVYVNNRQQPIERVFNKLIELKGLAPRLTIQNSEPIGTIVSEAEFAAIATLDERREKAGLKPMSAQPPQAAGMHKFSKADDTRLLQLFSEYGRPADEFNVLKSRHLHFSKDIEVAGSELQWQEMRFASPLTGKVSDLAVKILGILYRNPQLTPEEIARSLKTTPDAINDAISQLRENELLTISGNEWELTPDGVDSVQIEKPETATIEIVYSYGLAPGISGPILLDTSRDFCRELVRLNKKFTRGEIQEIQNRSGYNVWLYKGGFYHNPETGETTPFCRHAWIQEVVIRRSR